MKRTRWLLLLPMLMLNACTSPSSRFTEPIPPLRLIAGQADTLLISDIFYAGRYDSLRWSPHPKIRIDYQNDTLIAILHPAPDFEGLTTLELNLRGEIIHIPVFVDRLQQHTFRYRPSRPARSVTVMGSFNNWNRSSHPLTDPDGDGVYELTLPFEPGRYEYKFVVDGEEWIDPNNPDKVSNPFGSYNSVLTIRPRHPDTAFLHQLGYEARRDSLTLSFVFEHPDPPRLLQPADVIALLDNHRLPGEAIRIDGRRIDIVLPRAALTGMHWLRAAVSLNGQATLLQTVPLWNGLPADGRRNPFTWHDAVLYSIMIDRFFDGDPANSRPIDDPRLPEKTNYQGGDLQGILQKIEEGYFDSLGVNAIWISPVNDNTEKAHPEWPPPHRYFSGYHGYWPVHHQRVEEHFGDIELLRRLVQIAHDHGIRVLLDFIANHVHEDHPFFREHRDWFGSVELPDGRKNIRLWDEFRLTTWFEPFLPSFDYIGSEEALQTMTDNAVWWLEQTGADGFRHDAVKHIPNRFWRTLTRKLRQQVAPKRETPLFQIGETFGGYDLVKSYVNPGQLDGQFNFNVFYTARYVFLTPGADFGILRDELAKTHRVYGMNHLMGNIMDSHDQVRYMALADGDLALDSPDAAEIGWSRPPQVDNPQSYDKVRLYLTYLLTIPGVPTLYYGDEIGMTGAADPDNRRFMRFGDALNDHERALLAATRRLVHLRRQHTALRYGDFYPVLADAAVFAYLRSDMNERLLIVLNKSPQPQQRTLRLPAMYREKKARDLLTQNSYIIDNQHLQLRLSPVSGRIFRLE